jgi:hypothetical protein
MKIETIDRGNVKEADARAVAELLCAIWPKPGRTVETRVAELMGQWQDYRGPEEQRPRSFVVRDGARVVAHAGAYPRTITTSSGEMTVLALARVCTDPAVRGQNLGQAVTRAAFDLVDGGKFPFALFQTGDRVRSFYERLGAVTIDNRFVNSLAADPEASPWWDKVIMRYPAAAGWPTGQIDLRGPAW